MTPREALQIAVRNGDVARVQALLEAGVSPRFHSRTGETPLHMAARADHVRIVRLLIGAGADVNAREATLGGTPLHKAAAQGALESVDALLVAGADFNLQDNKGDTPLHKAMIMGRESVTYRLTRMGARLDIPNKRGWTPEELAQMGNYDRTNEQARLGQSLGHAGRVKHVYNRRRRKSGPKPS